MLGTSLNIFSPLSPHIKTPSLLKDKNSLDVNIIICQRVALKQLNLLVFDVSQLLAVQYLEYANQ